MPNWTYRLLLSCLFALLFALGFRVIQLSQASAAVFQGYYELMGISGRITTQVGNVFEGLTLGLLPVGTLIETVTLAGRDAAKALEAEAESNSWLFLCTALAIAVVSWLGSLWPSDSRHFTRCIVVVAAACMIVGQVAPIMSMTATSDVIVAGTSVVKQDCKSILTAVMALRENGKTWVAFLLALFSLVTPSLKLVVTLLAARTAHGGLSNKAMKAVQAIGKWSMADVFVVALLLAVFSLRSGPGDSVATNSEIEVGLWFFAGHCGLSMISTIMVTRRKGQPELLEGAPSSLGAATAQACLCVAATPLALLLLKPTRSFEKDETIQPGSRSCITLIALDAPGRIEGEWKSKGQEHGGADDTLVYVTIIGPNHQPIKTFDHEVSGSFDILAPEAGTYSVVFDNVGMIRATARSVHASIQFVPDSPLVW